MSLPDLSLAPLSDGPLATSRVSEASFTPTAAGLRPEHAAPHLDLQSLLSDVLAKLLVAGGQQGDGGSQPHSSGQQAPVWPVSSTRAAASTDVVDVSSEESDQAEGYPEDIEFSEDEGLLPDKPVFTGLFRPAVFKSLLHKAKVTTQFGMATVTSSGVQQPAAPHDTLFQVSKPDRDVIPCPPLFGLSLDPGGSYSQQASTQGGGRAPDRQNFRDRSRYQATSKRPF